MDHDKKGGGGEVCIRATVSFLYDDIIVTERGEARQRMNCDDCGGMGAHAVRVIFIDGEKVLLNLCRDCANEYRAGTLIEDVDVIDG